MASEKAQTSLFVCLNLKLKKYKVNFVINKLEDFNHYDL